LGLTPRALLVGLGGIALVSFLVAWGELVAVDIQIGLLQFPPAAFGVFLFVFAANAALRRLRPRLALSSRELAIAYSMMVIGAMVSSRGIMERLLPLLVAVNYLANSGNAWERIFFPHIKPWLVPWHPEEGPRQKVVLDFYEGLHGGEPIPWQPWVGPLLIWGALLACVLFAFLCLAALLRRQWSDHERLAFPLAQLPIEMLREAPERPLFRNPLMWAGLALPLFIHSFNGLHSFYPSLPQITTQLRLDTRFTTFPFNQLPVLLMNFSFAAIGFFYLLPSQLLFSFWFFYLFGHAQALLFALLGVEPRAMPHAAAHRFLGYETMGAYFVLAAAFLLAAWPYFRSIWRRARLDDRAEMMPYRFAAVGLIVSLLLAAVWLWLAGMALWLALFVLIIYVFVEAIIMARATSEGGLLMTEGCFTPIDVVALLARKSALGVRNLTALVWESGLFTRDLRGLTLTGFLDTQRLADGVRLRRRSLLFSLLLALLAAFVIAAVIQLWLPYRRGANTMWTYTHQYAPTQFFNEHRPLAEGLDTYQPSDPGFFVLGAGFTFLLSVLRARYAGWPLHPLGFAMSSSWSLVVYWFPLLVAWLCKTLSVHYGGMKFFVKARTFFLGLIFGEMLAALLWTLISSLWNVPAPLIPFD
jgi:hypothetical protein